MEQEREQTAISFSEVERDAQAFQQSVSLKHIQTVCREAFGHSTRIVSVTEMDDGQFNNTYVIYLEDRRPVILRVAPSPERCIFWHEQELMRREVVMQYCLSPLASLLQAVLVADFTHRIIERDYLFKTYVPGVLWSKIERDFSEEEHNSLWREFGRLVKEISRIQGETFGVVAGGPKFSRWSLAILDWLERTTGDAQSMYMDTSRLERLLTIVRENTHFLDEVTTPRLLHGDLWTFNLLVERKESGPSIVAVLDADRGSWGDPLADWTFFLLGRASKREQALFWEVYGRPEQTQAVQFRAHVYRGLHNGKILSVAKRDGNERAVGKAYDALTNVVTVLQQLIGG